MNAPPATSQLQNWRLLFSSLGARPTALFVASFLSLLSAAFEGISAGLLIPTLEGALRGDFSFLRGVRGVKAGLEVLPGWATEGDAELFGLLLAVVFVSVFLKLSLQYASSLLFQSALWRLVRRLRVFCMERYLRFGKRFFDERNAGQLKTLLLSHPRRLVGAVQQAQWIIYWGCSLVMYVALMLLISWKLTLLLVVLFPILYVSITGLVRRIRKTSEHYAAANRKLDEHCFNLLSCMSLVRGMNQEQAELGRVSGLCDDVTQLEISQAKKQQLLQPLQELILIAGVLALVVLAAGIHTEGGGGSLSGFLVFFYLLRRSATNFSDLNRSRGTFGVLSGLLDEMLEILSDDDKHYVPGGSRTFEGLESEIRLKGLSFSYLDEVPVLKDVSCVFQKGKTTAVVGRTGSGKTTLVSLLMRFYEVEPGALCLDGVDIREFSLNSLRSHMAYVSQDTLLLNDTIRANILYGIEREVSEEELLAVVKRSRLDVLVEKQPEGLAARVGDRGVKVSGGEKQRVALARALLREAEILILDEATSSLDTETERLVQEAIDACLVDRTAIVIAHRLSTIKNADWVVLIEEGRLVEEGTLEELLGTKGRFYDYWKAQNVGDGEA